MTPVPAVIVALGDSTTAGTPGFRSALEAPPDGAGDVTSQYAFWLMRLHPEWRVLNRGINGERSDEIGRRFARDVVAERDRASGAPFLAVIIAGVNDSYQGRPASTVQRELQTMYEDGRRAGIPIVAGSIIPYNTATPDANARMHEVNAWIARFAASHDGLVFCDTRAAVATPASPDRLLTSPDDLHPSPGGYRAMAHALEPAIATLLGKSGAVG